MKRSLLSKDLQSSCEFIVEYKVCVSFSCFPAMINSWALPSVPSDYDSLVAVFLILHAIKFA